MVSPVKNKTPKNYMTDEKALKKFVRQMIKNHDFVGSYLEKRYVFDLNCYKKIIKISKYEDIFIENLTIIKRRLENFYQNTRWIGISSTDTPGAPVGLNIWVDIDEEVIGVYKFWVKDVLFSENQVVLKVEMIKPCKEKGSSREKSWLKSSSSILESSGSSMDECQERIISWENFKNSVVFIFLLILAILTGGGHIIKYLLDYILKFLEVSTPIIIAFLNTITRSFGYLCFLIAFMWRGNPSKNQYYKPSQSISYYQPAYPYENRYKALQYRPKSSVIITELKE